MKFRLGASCYRSGPQRLMSGPWWELPLSAFRSQQTLRKESRLYCPNTGDTPLMPDIPDKAERTNQVSEGIGERESLIKKETLNCREHMDG